jgi:type VI secretion system protein VasJ
MFDLGAIPISSDAPGGTSVSDDVRYDRLQEYFSGLEDVPWDDVVVLASGLLKECGKDLKVAAQLGVALSEERGLPGLLDAYACWRGLLSEEIWPHVQPKRTRGQANAISWFFERVGDNVRGAYPSAEDIDTLKELRASAKEVEALIDERMGEKAPQVGSVSRLFKDHLEQLELDMAAAGDGDTAEDSAAETEGAGENEAGSESEEDTDRDEKAATKAATKAEAGATKSSKKKAKKATSAGKATAGIAAAPAKPVDIPDVPGDGASLKEGEKAFGKLTVPVLQTLENIRRGAPDRPAPYLLAREWVWALASTPVAKDGKTSIPSPGSRDSSLWDAMAGRGEWSEMLHSAETRWTKSMFWLDPHRYVGQALAELGLDDALIAVGSGLGQLLYRMPGLVDMSFVDGTPLADEETKAWIAAHAKMTGGGPTITIGGGPVTMTPIQLGEGDGLPAFLEDAEKLLKKDKFAEAVLGFESGLVRVPDLRIRFRLKLKFAQQLLLAERVHVARPMLEALDEEVVRFELETWEPRLAALVVQTLLAAMSSKGHPDEKNPDFAQKLLLLRVRLARLDTLSALETGT